MSEKKHGDGSEHDSDYDHEAFLGKSATEFDDLTPEQSKEKLGVIVDKIDTDKDGFVSEKEMIAWIKYIQKSYVSEDAKHQWENMEKKDKNVMSWDDYAKVTYGEHTDDLPDGDDTFSYSTMKERDARRFKMADTNYDDVLSFSEYVDFLHPEDAEHMRDIVVMETIEDIDKDKDGIISESEYIGDMYSEPEDEEPDWVVTEREHFSKWRDLNKDGVMDKDEVRHWIMPDDYDHAQAESKHLIYEADGDKDGKLTKAEILEKYDLFVGSQATDFGEALTKTHDEF